MPTPASYTLLGIALALGTLSVVGMGGAQLWYYWETSFNSRSDDQFGASAVCSHSADPTDPLAVGLDLVLSQDAYTDQVTVSGLVIGGGVMKGIGARLRLSSDKSCNPNPTNFIAETRISPAKDSYADVDWTLSDYRLDGTGNDITGDVIVVQSSTAQMTTLSCCTITRLPGVAGVTSRRWRRATSVHHDTRSAALMTS